MGTSAKEYAVFVQIMDPPPSIRTGMTAAARIFVEQIPNAIQVPVHAVYESKNHHFVLIKDGDGWKTNEIKLGGTNEKFVTVLSGVNEKDMVALDPRNHVSKMNIPDIPEVDDREKLAKIASEAPPVAKTAEAKQGGGKPGSGRPESGGPPNPDAIASSIFSSLDTNSDGKLTKDEVASNERMAGAFSEYDTNKDGSIDRTELTAVMRKRMAAGGGGGGGGGSARGAPSN
jgi:hypothetical protein